MLIYGLLIACMGAQEVDVRSIPAEKRIAYVNKLADCQKGRNADKYYQDAIEHYVPLYMLYPEDDAKQREQYQHVEYNLDGLARTDHWTATERKIIEAWLEANKKTLKALKQATGRLRYFHSLETDGGRLHTAVTPGCLDAAPYFKGLATLAAVVANRHALQGDWDEAYQWNLCVHRMADHAFQGPFSIQRLMAFGIEQIAQDHLLVLLQRQAPTDLPKIKGAILAGDNLRCTPELTDSVEDLWTIDHIEAWYEWIDNPEKHPDLTSLIDFFYGDQSAPPELAELALDGLKVMPEKHFKEVAELRKALAGSSVKNDYKVACEAKETYKRWCALPFHETWKQRREFVAAYCKVLVRAPSMVAVGCGGSTIALGYKREVVGELERQATLTVIALLQFRKDSGRLPQQLAELVPKHLTEVPIDAFSGKPLIYRLDKDGKDFTLYTIGMDQVDDGGRLTERLEETGDLVFWPPPKVEIEGR